MLLHTLGGSSLSSSSSGNVCNKNFSSVFPAKSATFTRLYSRKRIRRYYYAVPVSFRTCATNHRNSCFSAKEIVNTRTHKCSANSTRAFTLPNFERRQFIGHRITGNPCYRLQLYFNVAIKLEKSKNTLCTSKVC